MTRFRLNTEDSDVHVSEAGGVNGCTVSSRIYLSDSDNDVSDSSSSSCDDYDDDSDEPDHPLGFATPQRWEQSWLSLDPHPFPKSQKTTGVYSLDLFDSDDEEEVGNVPKWMCKEQAYPPYSSYLDPNVAPTSALLKYYYGSQGYRIKPSDDLGSIKLHPDEGIDYITNLYSSISIQEHQMPHSESYKLLPKWSDSQARISQKVEGQIVKIESEHKSARDGMKKILEDLSRQAKKIHDLNKADEKAQAEAIEAHRSQLEKDNEAHRKEKERKAKELREEAKREQEALDEQKRIEVAQEKESEEREAKKVEHIIKAKKLVLQLAQLRESIKGFETSKAVSKRRLNMKKVAGGKLNMLTEDAGKIMAVSNEVSNAITAARNDDEQVKKAIEEGNDQSVTKDMMRGKRYLIDLIASKAMERIQSDSFNGPRGDGFPLAVLLSAVSKENQELVPIMAAHIYTVCPAAIPTLPASTSNISDDEWMTSLGMQRDKKGEFETFDAFLSRTENIIALMADIMSSTPVDHMLLGGHGGAALWLTRFLALLPPAPASPLPLLTAPVLVAFLSRAGHMLANVHAESFREQVSFISDDVVRRLDESSIGKPSSVRLLKVLEGGFKSFKDNLPHKALAPLYLTSLSLSQGMLLTQPSGQMTAGFLSGTSGFGQSAGGSSSVTSNPFGAPTQSSGLGGFGTNNQGQAVSNPFGGSSGANPSPFEVTGLSRNANTSTVSNPFGGNASLGSNPFGGNTSTAISGSSLLGGDTSTTNASPFGASLTLGNGTSSNSNPFGGTEKPNSTSFGVTNMISNSTPFGATNTTSSSSPFGVNSMASNPSPFGANNAASNPGLYGATNTTSNRSPFGASAMNPSPFGAPATESSNPSPFGTMASASGSNPFGASSKGMNLSPFGGGGSNSNPFGSSLASTNPSPFGGVGGGGNQNTPFGKKNHGTSSSSGGGKPPCKFYAKGNCRYGNNCKFSHDLGGGSNNRPFGGGFGSPFGR